LDRVLGPSEVLLHSWEPHKLAVDTPLATTAVVDMVVGFNGSLDMGLEGLVASGAFVVAFALAVLGVPVVWAFRPIMVMPRNPAWIGFLFVGGIVSFVVIVSLAIRIRVIRGIRTSPVIALVLSR